jgi:regulator of sigma E protease
MTGEVAKLGFVYVLQFAAILSVNLAVINILPFPALDGGRLLFLFIEAVRRRAVDEKTEAVVHNIGFALLMALVVLVTYRDFVKFGGQMWGAIRGFVGM